MSALFCVVGAPGIEPGPYVPKTYILPIYYAPKCLLNVRQNCLPILAYIRNM